MIVTFALPIPHPSQWQWRQSAGQTRKWSTWQTMPLSNFKYMLYYTAVVYQFPTLLFSTASVSLVAELLELLVPALEMFLEEVTPLGLEVNRQKTMVQALSSTKDEPPSLHVCVCGVQRVKSFVYLGAMIHLSCSSDPEICRRSAMTRSAMQSLDWHLWRSCITTMTRLHLYKVFILTFLYGSECWAVNKVDLQWIDALDQQFLWRILVIGWHDFVRNVDVHHMTNQPPLSSIVKSCRLSFFGHLARMDENADASQFIFEPSPDSWRCPTWQSHTTWMKTIQGNLSSLDLELHEVRELAQNRPSWRLMSLYSAMHS